MPKFFVRALNSAFDGLDANLPFETSDLALAAGLDGAIGIASDEVRAGCRSSVVVISVEDLHGKTFARSAITLCVSPLLADELSPAEALER